MCEMEKGTHECGQTMSAQKEPQMHDNAWQTGTLRVNNKNTATKLEEGTLNSQLTLL